ncbi:helix-turn-helix domain-containing protein [Paenibacillus sp. 481]|uniref:helix-turn-helix domain-containing protein n=1 Tax=Paenibacillus sp. 481 TaxID=2835869 RepID=UPI001E3A9E73|nr:helix-turn-helix domain-containing protein [Paenibacillus sp. 481]UHA72635.1 ABC transporter substrate-binding protein [Paenibacillus sp. 481]
MSNRTLSPLPLRNLLFHLESIETVKIRGGTKSEPIIAKLHTILIVEHGAGTLYINDTIHHLSPHRGYLLPPETRFLIVTNDVLQYYHIRFTAIRVGKLEHSTHRECLLPDRHELRAYPASRLIGYAQSLVTDQPIGRDHELESYYQQLRFQEMMGFLLEQNLHFERPLNSTQAVVNTIHYVEKHYMQQITVQQLAALANVPRWQYSSIFQELTGKKPLDYLTEVRINRSKEWLQHSFDPLRDIAQRVGFADEYYFNRRFRQTTGTTPRQYALSTRRTMHITDWIGHQLEIPCQAKRIICYSETFGDLLALGVEPIGGGLAMMEAAFFVDQVHHVQDVGFPINVEKTKALNPDLIISASPDKKQVAKLSAIAPTVTFNSFASLEHRLHTLGHMFGRQQEAERWLHTYHEKANSMWRQLQSMMKPSESASVFIYDRGSRLFVMGAIGLSTTLYHPLGFQPAYHIQHLLDSDEPYAEITEAELPDYAGDHIFMLRPTNTEAEQAASALMNSSLWRSLPAVMNGRAYSVEKAWNYGDALTRAKLLDTLPQLLCRSPLTEVTS